MRASDTLFEDRVRNCICSEYSLARGDETIHVKPVLVDAHRFGSKRAATINVTFELVGEVDPEQSQKSAVVDPKLAEGGKFAEEFTAKLDRPWEASYTEVTSHLKKEKIDPKIVYHYTFDSRMTPQEMEQDFRNYLTGSYVPPQQFAESRRKEWAGILAELTTKDIPSVRLEELGAVEQLLDVVRQDVSEERQHHQSEGVRSLLIYGSLTLLMVALNAAVLFVCVRGGDVAIVARHPYVCITGSSFLFICGMVLSAHFGSFARALLIASRLVRLEFYRLTEASRGVTKAFFEGELEEYWARHQEQEEIARSRAPIWQLFGQDVGFESTRTSRGRALSPGSVKPVVEMVVVASRDAGYHSCVSRERTTIQTAPARLSTPIAK